MTMRNTANYTAPAMDAANENTPMFFCKDYRNAVITLVAASSAECTVKIYGSSMEDRPDLDNAASATNEYSPIATVNLDTGANVVGSTGITREGVTDGVSKFEINTNALNWIGVEMTARTAGSVSVSIDMYDNS